MDSYGYPWSDNPEAGVPDMTTISNLDEKGINRNLQVRYLKDQIYTYSGTILVAVNPYKELSIYSTDHIWQYHGAKLGMLEPHVFALAEAAYTSLQATDHNQSCVISGESGAGKTETTKFILQYLCSVTSTVSTWVEHQILEANTVMEAFGNAKTVRNDNSSRFGKFMQVCLDKKWMIKGCIIQDYLLEQSRITFQSNGERNYHVFYQLVSAAKINKEIAEQYKLKPAEFFAYLNQSDCISIEGINDALKYDTLCLAFNVLRIPLHMVEGIFSTLSAILWLGNLTFQDIDGERCQLTEEDHQILKTVAELLGLQVDDLAQVVLLRQINVRGCVTEIPLKFQEAKENRHAMAKALYSRVFAWLVNHINTCTNPGQDSTRFLGVLDIFGFENFAVNSFEQLCINYTNEKLQKFFNNYVFALEQQTYREEGIEYSHIEFTDNTECLELIEKPPRCIFKLLTEQCHMPKGSDSAYLVNLHSEFESHPYYIKGDDRRRWELEFGVNHYAGTVIYSVAGFVDKNRDVQQDVFFDFISRSSNSLVQQLYIYQDLLGATVSKINAVNSSNSCTALGTLASRGTSKGKPTVSDTFRHQLQALVEVLQATNPWYVRCIKPNMIKKPNHYDEVMVSDQLRYLGMLYTIMIHRQCYPVHLRFQDFFNKYYCLAPRNGRRKTVDETIRAILKGLNFPNKDWQIGKTKVFIRTAAFETLEENWKNVVAANSLVIQRYWRGYVVRKEFRRIRTAVLKLQYAFRGWKQRVEFLRQRRAAIVIQAHLRGVFAREVASALREMRRVEDEMRKREEAEKLKEQAKEEEPEEDGDEKSEGENGVTPEEISERKEKQKEEVAALARHLNNKLRESKRDSVDLDNLFAFLSDSQNGSKKRLIDQIGEKMNELVNDLDYELESVLQQELESLNLQNNINNNNGESINGANNHTNNNNNNNAPTSLSPLHKNIANLTNKVNGSKSIVKPIARLLPEPTVPPPPPPVTTSATVPKTEEIRQSGNTLKNGSPSPSPRSVDGNEAPKKSGGEPIYESVIPRDENGRGPCTSPPPLPAPPYHKFRPKSPTFERIRSNSPGANLVSPKQSRPNSRGSSVSTGMQSPYSHRTGSANICDEPATEMELNRRNRVEKRLQELSVNGSHNRTTTAPNNLQENYHDIVEFAQTHFNDHIKTPEGTIMATLTRKSKALEVIPKYEMVTHYRGCTIPTSHLKLYDPDNITIACSMFRDLCKYSRGELKPESELSTLQTIIKYALDREELRDELYVQCMRQVTNNPFVEHAEQIWLLLCLCIVAFQPSKALYKYFISFLHKNLQCEGKLRQYVQWCLDNCKNTKASSRQYPPSTVEIAAMKRLGTIVCRFFFLDGRTKAIDIHPTDTASDAASKLADKLGLRSLDGWAVYQSRPDGEEHVRSHCYLYDVIAEWEMKQNKMAAAANSSGFASLTRKSSSNATLGAGENRFIFKKRLFRSSREISQDPVEVNLLYAQAVYSVVKCDDFPVSEKVALQLAGLQAQVALGDPKMDKLDYYADIDSYLPYRISRCRGEDVWVPIIAEAHRQYGAGRSELMAKVLYLSCVMQYPLYGTTMFQVTYRGYWSYGNNVILGINCHGILLIKPEDKLLLYEFDYSQMESLHLDPSDNFITINLTHQHNTNNSHQHHCIVFETAHRSEIASLIVSYYPPLTNCITQSELPIKLMTTEDRVRLYHNLVNARRALVDSDLLRKPLDSAANFIRNTLRRLSKTRLEKLRLEGAETYRGFGLSYWTCTRHPITQSLSRLSEQEEEIALQMFQLILTYAGLGQNGEALPKVATSSEDDQLALVQSLTERALSSNNLLNELYLQLIKQTTPTTLKETDCVNMRASIRYWALLCITCSLSVPPAPPLGTYCLYHLKHSAATLRHNQMARYASYAEKLLLKAQGKLRRQLPPSREEIFCTVNRRPIYTRIFFMDGQYHTFEILPSATAKEVVEAVKAKICLRENAMGYALYEVCGSSERSLLSEEKLADVMSKWERQRKSIAASVNINNSSNGKQTIKRQSQQHLFLFKKHLFLDQFLDLDDPVEKELLYHQVLHSLRCDRYPISENEAIMLCSLQAQVEFSDSGTLTDANYHAAVSHCMSARLVPNIPLECVAMHHQSLRGMTSDEAKKAFLSLIKSWPLHQATIFDVMQSFTSNWPRVLWLAVDQTGLHLLEHRSRHTLVTYEYSSILSYSPALNCLMIITITEQKQSKVILTTSQAFQIATLIKEYTDVLKKARSSVQKTADSKKNCHTESTKQLHHRPLSILHKPAPEIDSTAVSTG
nr:PREDICTED: unconventional myosin-VIIa [Bemisia tabaci]